MLDRESRAVQAAPPNTDVINAATATASSAPTSLAAAASRAQHNVKSHHSITLDSAVTAIDARGIPA